MPVSYKYEIIVKFVNSERDDTLYFPSPESFEHTKISNDATALTNGDTTLHTVKSREPRPAYRPASPKIALYECSEYKVENGVLVMKSSNTGIEGFMVPLSVIQEIQIQTPDSKRSNIVKSGELTSA